MHLYRLCVGQKAINMVQKESFDQSTMLITAQARGATPLWAHQLPAEGEKKKSDFQSLKCTPYQWEPLSQYAVGQEGPWWRPRNAPALEESKARGRTYSRRWLLRAPPRAAAILSKLSTHPTDSEAPPHSSNFSSTQAQLSRSFNLAV